MQSRHHQTTPGNDTQPEYSSYGEVVSVVEADGHLRKLNQIEADIIRLAVRHYRGQMSEVARRLGIGRSTLYRKLAELDLNGQS